MIVRILDIRSACSPELLQHGYEQGNVGTQREQGGRPEITNIFDRGEDKLKQSRTSKIANQTGSNAAPNLTPCKRQGFRLRQYTSPRGLSPYNSYVIAASIPFSLEPCFMDNRKRDGEGEQRTKGHKLTK